MVGGVEGINRAVFVYIVTIQILPSYIFLSFSFLLRPLVPPTTPPSISPLLTVLIKFIRDRGCKYGWCWTAEKGNYQDLEEEIIQNANIQENMQ